MSSVRSWGVGCEKSAWRIPVNYVPVSALFDAAAKIIIVAQSVHDQMSPRRKFKQICGSCKGGKTMTIGAHRYVLQEIGGTHVRHLEYVAPLLIDMLLSIDVLHKN